MKIVFAGTPDFAATILAGLIEAGEDIAEVYTQPDRPAGRGRHLQASAVKQLAQEHNLSVHQPQTLRIEEEVAHLSALKPDLMIVVAYGLILPKAILDIPRLGCINVHASLLPRWRGAAPIQYAILSGDKETGVTIMQMDEGMDTGGMLYPATCIIDPADTAQSLHDKLALLGRDSLLKTLPLLRQGKVTPVTQDEDHVTYAPKITKNQGMIDWHQTAAEIDCAVRAFNPWPVTSARIDGRTVRVWAGKIVADKSGLPGEILASDKQGITVATGDGAYCITELQLPGKKRMSAWDCLHAHQELFALGNHFL